MILYGENPKDSTKTLLDLISEVRKAVACKINIQKSVVLLYTKEVSEKETKKLIPFTIASPTIKYLGTHLTEEVKDLYSENFKTLMKKIKDDTNGRRLAGSTGVTCDSISGLLIKPHTGYRDYLKIT